MFIDTSAIVAILTGEAEAAKLADAIAAAQERYTSPVVRLEATMVMATRLNVAPSQAQTLFEAFREEATVVEVPLDARIGALAVACFETYGKGRHPAQLNLADCLSYACAKALGAPLLYKGEDFAKTDVNG
ncbi:MAG TPA: type II toxin-antitoxin system VapC family toxin [Roseiarcus sp.]|jgi:ribonuclease VapC